MNNLLENLNPEQLRAVTHKHGPLLIVAGAGTGKTTAITQRIAYLIEQGLVGAEEILALTFTEKAASEMVERVDQLLPFGYLDLWISTFHGFAERIIKEHGLAIGLSTDFKLLNQFEQWALIKKNLDKFSLDYYRPLGNPTKFIHALLKHFSRAKDEDIGPRAYLEYASELRENCDAMLSGAGGKKRGNFQFPISNFQTNSKSQIQNKSKMPAQPASRPAQCGAGWLQSNQNLKSKIDELEVARLNEVANAYHIYQQLLLDSNGLDFGDLINYCLKLFRERPAILQQYRRQFKYILVDEFQDTNWAQYELVKMLAAPKHNLVVVGDDDQSVYRFRGASMSNILQFKQDFPEAKEIALIRNYRNKQNILDLSYEFIQKNNPNRLEYQLKNSNNQETNNKQIPNSKFQIPNLLLSKKLIAQNSGQGEIGVIRGADLAEEVRLVVNKIIELKAADKESSWNDFAILVRANDSAKEFAAELERRGLPYIFWASRGLYAKPIIMDVIAYFNLLDNYHESAAVYRALKLPMFEFSHEDLIEFNHLADKKTWSLYEVLANAASLKFDQAVQVKIDKFLALINRHAALARDRTAAEMFKVFLNDSGYLKYLTGLPELKQREAFGYLNQFMKRLQVFEAASDDKTVKVFLGELNMEMEAGEEGQLAVDLDAGPETIRLMTVHAAKGLEFTYVFIANLVDKRFPTIERREAIALPDALVKEILPQGDIHLEEERRLFYVAMTRARQGLFMSWAEDYGGARKKKASRFLHEIGMVGQETKNRILSSAIKTAESLLGDSAAALNSKLKIQNSETAKELSSEASELSSKSGQIQNPIPSARDKIQNFSVPAYFSYSQLAAYSNCPYQYRFAHILKVPVGGKGQFSFGKTMHVTMEKLFNLVNERRGLGQADLFSNAKPRQTTPNHAIVNFEEALNLYEQCWIDEWYGSKKIKQEKKEQGRKIIKEFLAKHQPNWPKAVYLEKTFNYKLIDGNKQYTIRGTIDRIDEQAGQLKIIDYKTGAPKEKLSFADKEQLLVYQLAASELFSEEVASLAYYYLENNSELEFQGSQADLDKIKAKVIRTIEEIKQGDFPPKPSQLCQFCDFFGICEYRQGA